MTDLQDRDYIALAGVNKYFRKHLTDDFFKVGDDGYQICGCLLATDT
jgi:hypothetical protein